MADSLRVLIPLYAFMLIPVWIPLASIVIGSVLDVVKPRQEHRGLVGQQTRQHAVRVHSAPEAARPAIGSAGA